MVTNNLVGRKCVEVCPVPACVEVKITTRPPRRERVLNNGVVSSVILSTDADAKEGIADIPQDAQACSDVLGKVLKVAGYSRTGVIGGTTRCPYSKVVEYSSASKSES